MTHAASVHPVSRFLTGMGDNGFTLIELIVVMALLSIMLAVTFPKFDHLLSDETRKLSQWIQLKSPEYRNLSAKNQQVYTLHADMDEERFWFSGSGMSDEELDSAREKGFVLSEKIEIADVIYSSGEFFNAGDAPVHFYPKGYSDKAIVHVVTSGGDYRSFIFEPFLSQVEVADGYIEFEN